MHHRDFIKILSERFQEKRPLMQFLIGPRQVGKTTGVEYFLEKYAGPIVYELVEADLQRDQAWLRLQWQKALSLGPNAILVIDEIQKIENWAEVLKSLWDKNRKNKKHLKCLFLGSSSLNLTKGLTESLTGRFEVIQVYHWDYVESKKICGDLSFDEFCLFGGYPKSYDYLRDRKRFQFYIRDSVVKNAIEKDILLNHTVKKPALFKQTAEVLAGYPAREISYTKILGRLQEGGNVELTKYYIQLLEGSYLYKAVPKFSGPKSKVSTPKIIVLAQALIFSLCPTEIDFGHRFENMVGAELLKHVDEIFYWREGNYELDFVVRINKKTYAIEVKSGRKKHSKSIEVFLEKHPDIPIVILDQDEYLRLCREKQDFFESV